MWEISKYSSFYRAYISWGIRSIELLWMSSLINLVNLLIHGDKYVILLLETCKVSNFCKSYVSWGKEDIKFLSSIKILRWIILLILELMSVILLALRSNTYRFGILKQNCSFSDLILFACKSRHLRLNINCFA